MDYDSAGRPVGLAGNLAQTSLTRMYEVVPSQGTSNGYGGYDALGRVPLMRADDGRVVSARRYNAFSGALEGECKRFGDAVACGSVSGSGFGTPPALDSATDIYRTDQVADAVALQNSQQNPGEQAASSPQAEGVTKAPAATTTPANPGNPKAMAPPANTVDLGGVVVTAKLREGAWGSSTTVWHPGTEATTFANTTSVGDNGKEILPGAYNFVVGRHPLGDVEGKTPYTALNIYTRDWSRELPATLDGERATIKGGNFHFGNRPDSPKGAGSDGCHVCPKSDWSRFINLFYASGERGTYLFIDLAGRRP